MRKLVKPAHDDPHHSVDLFGADRRNQWGGYACIAPAILPEQVEEHWRRYVREEREQAQSRLRCLGRGEEADHGR